MNIARATFGIGDNEEEVEGDPSEVLAEITRADGPVTRIEFEFDGGKLTITEDNDVLGAVKGIDHSAFILKKVTVHAKKKTKDFCGLKDAIAFARKEPGFEDFEFEICATTPQGKKTLKKKFKEVIIDVNDETCEKSGVKEKSVKKR